MNYRHSYHAGSFADVFKHTVLLALMRHIQKKAAACCYIDTHAGIGIYDLGGDDAKRTQAYQTGIIKLWHALHPPPLIDDYLSFIKATQGPKPQELRYYPGSPLFIHHAARSYDRILLSECHPDDGRLLQQTMHHYPNVHIHLRDGYVSLKALLPPKERRGLILIDPPYEDPDEYQRLSDALSYGLARFATGMYAIWYPIKDRTALTAFMRRLKAVVNRPGLRVELSVYPETSSQPLSGSGMLVINPPWQLADTLAGFLPWLTQTLSHPQPGDYRILAF